MIRWILLLMPALSMGCASFSGHGTVQKADQVSVNYTCYIDGRLAATTSKEINDDSGILKSEVFVPRKNFGPIPFEAGEDPACVECERENDLKRFEFVIESQISKSLVGLKYDKNQAIEIDAEERDDVIKSERYISLARITNAPKELRMAKDQYRAHSRENPAADQEVRFYQGLLGKVMLVREDEIVIRFEPLSKAPINGPFGDIVVHDRGEYYEIEVLVEKGKLVRTGPLVGTVIDVQDRIFTLDYGRPFGGRTLNCDIRIER